MGQIEDINKKLENIELLLKSIDNQLRKMIDPKSAQGDGAVYFARVPEMIPEMITIREASCRTGLSYDFIRKGCLRGDIVHIRVGSGKMLINFDLLKEQLKSSHGSIRKKEDI